MTNMAGDMAAQAVTNNLTADNVQKSAQYCTVDNAQKGYQGYEYADKKADEMGIDKQAVGAKVGNAALTAGKYAWEGLKGIDYAKAWDNTKQFGNTVLDANKKEQASKK